MRPTFDIFQYWPIILCTTMKQKSRGTALIEYILLAILIGIAVIPSAKRLGQNINNNLDQSAANFSIGS